jgi:hypothetical protein
VRYLPSGHLESFLATDTTSALRPIPDAAGNSGRFRIHGHQLQSTDRKELEPTDILSRMALSMGRRKKEQLLYDNAC